MSRIRALLFVLAVVVAGCASAPGAPTDAPDQTRLQITNDHDRDYEVTVSVAPVDHRGLAVEFANGSVRTYPAARWVEDLPGAALASAVAVRPIGEGVRTETYPVNRSTGIGDSLTVSPGTRVVFTIALAGGDAIRSSGSVTCGPEATMTELSLRVDADGSVFASNRCLVE